MSAQKDIFYCFLLIYFTYFTSTIIFVAMHVRVRARPHGPVT